ncbi:MAG: hypothetical protein ACK4NC_07385, partial [Candidatus Gracilibacteria bacterium]
LSHRNNYQGFEEYIPAELRKNVSPQPPKQAVEANVPDDSNAVNVQPPEEPVSVEQTVSNLDSAIEKAQEKANQSKELVSDPYNEGQEMFSNDQDNLPSSQYLKEEYDRKQNHVKRNATQPLPPKTYSPAFREKLLNLGKLASKGRKAVIAQTIRERVLGDSGNIEIDITSVRDSLANIPKEKKLAILTAGFLDPTGEISGVRIHRGGEAVSSKDVIAAIRNNLKNGNNVAKRISETIGLTSHSIRTNSDKGFELLEKIFSNPKNQGKVLDANYTNLFGGDNPKYRRILSAIGLPDLKIDNKGISKYVDESDLPIRMADGSKFGVSALTPKDYVDYRTASVPVPSDTVLKSYYMNRISKITSEAEANLAAKLGRVEKVLEDGTKIIKMPDNLYEESFDRAPSQLLIKSPYGKTYKVMFSSVEEDSDIAEFFLFKKKKKKPDIGKVIRNLYMVGGVGAGLVAGGLMLKDRLDKNAIKTDFQNKIERLRNLKRINNERSVISQLRQHVLASDLAELSGGVLNANNPTNPSESVVVDAFNLLTVPNQDIKETNGIRHVTSRSKKTIFNKIASYNPTLSSYTYGDGKILSGKKVISAVNRAVMLRARALRGGLSDSLASKILENLPKQDIADLKWSDPDKLKDFVEKVDMLDRDVFDSLDALGRQKIIEKLSAGELTPKEFLDSSQSPRQYIRRKAIVNEIAGLPSIKAKNMPFATDKYYVDDIADSYVGIPTNHAYAAGVTFLDPKTRRPNQESYLVSHSTKKDRDKTKAFIATLGQSSTI